MQDQGDAGPVNDKMEVNGGACGFPTGIWPTNPVASTHGNCYRKRRMIILLKLALAVGSGLIILALL